MHVCRMCFNECMDTNFKEREMTTETPEVRVAANGLTKTIKMHGMTLRTRTPRRYVVVTVRPEPITVVERRFSYANNEWTTGPSTYVPYLAVEKRTDNLQTARKAAAKADHGPGSYAVVVDTFQAR